MLVEKPRQHFAVVAVASDDPFAPQRPVVLAANADDLTVVFAAEIMKSVIARDAGDAGNEQRQGRVWSAECGIRIADRGTLGPRIKV